MEPLEVKILARLGVSDPYGRPHHERPSLKAADPEDHRQDTETAAIAKAWKR